MAPWHDKIKKIAELLQLDLHPQAVKMLTSEDEIPASATLAGEEFGHLSYCQAQALAKREGRTIYMDRKSHWCWAPLVGFGMVDCSPESPAYSKLIPFLGIADPEKIPAFFAEFPMLPYQKYTGTVVGPAESADFDPDVILINCDNNAQLRALFQAIKFQTGQRVKAEFEAFDSCVYTVVKSMITDDYTVAVPDPGDQERALSGPHEMILGLPFGKLDELYNGMTALEKHMGFYPNIHLYMEYDFERPPFYNEIFRLWGLDEGRDIKM